MNDKLHDLIRAFPFPLCGMMEQTAELHERAKAGEEPAGLPEAICRANAFLLRFDAAITISALAHSDQDFPALNAEVIKALRDPADGTWKGLLGHLCKEQKLQQPLIDRLRSQSNKALQGFEKLVSYRNAYMHNKRPLGQKDHSEHFALLRDVIEQHSFLADYALVTWHEGRWVLACGYEVRTLGETSGQGQEWETALLGGLKTAESGQVFFVHRENAQDRLQVSPLIHHFAGEGDQIRLDNLFFLNRGTQDALEYILHSGEHRYQAEEVGLDRQSFLELLRRLPTPPIPTEPRLSYTVLADEHSQNFVGRTEVLDEIRQAVRATDKKYLELRAYSGMGKTAILCQLFNEHRGDINWPTEKKQAAEKMDPSQDLWAFHFCGPLEGRNHPLVALKSITAQICDGAGLQRHQYEATDAIEQKQKLLQALKKAVSHLSDDRRVVICIDALDEGIPSYGNRTVPGLLPGKMAEGEEGLELPERVVFLVSYRVQSDGTNRVEHYLKDARIPDEWRARVESANPLKGLAKPRVEEYLNQVAAEVNQPDVSSGVVERVFNAATIDHGVEFGADPFFLRFLQSQVYEGAVDLKRKESVPENLNVMFELFWMGLPTDHDYALHRILATVAILRESASDELALAVINQGSDQELVLDEVRQLRMRASKLLVYNGDRYALFHDRFRTFLVGESPERLKMALEQFDALDQGGRFSPAQVARLHRALGELTGKWGESPIKDQLSSVREFALHQGPHHLLSGGQLEEAAGLLMDYGTCNERLKANRSDEWVADLETANQAAVRS